MKKFFTLSSLALMATMAFAQESIETRAHYSTNPDGAVGKYATITIDGEFNDWDASMLIATGGANDQCNAFKGAHENCVLDMYALYGAWDDTYLYIGWQMVNTADIWAREGDGPLSDGGRVLDVPLVVALSIDPSTPTMTGKNTSGQGLWGGKADMGFGFETHVDRLLLMSGKPGLGQPAMFKACDAQGNSKYDAPYCLNFSTNDISYKMKEGFMPNDLWRMKLASPKIEDIYEEENYVDLLSSAYTEKKHKTSYDSFYEIKIPLKHLGISRAWLEANGIGCRVLATRGESAIDCLPFDPSMLDNVKGNYGSDPSTSHEKDDFDLITYRMADIGHVRDISAIPPVDNPDVPDTPDDPEITPTDGEWEVYFQDNGQPAWTNVMTWIWDGNNESTNFTGGKWPGASMTAISINGKQTWKYAFNTNGTTFTTPMVIFNNGGGEQTDDFVLKNHGIYDRNGLIGTNSGISTVVADKAKVSVTGMTISAEGGIALYTTMGRLVGEGTSVTATEKGVYIAITPDGKAHKLLLR